MTADVLDQFTLPRGFKAATITEVRAWALDNGYKFPERQGRPPAEPVEAFNKAHKRNRRKYIPGTPAASEYEYTTATGRAGKFTATPAQVRAWARENGLTVGDRGRFSAQVRDAYGQAHAPVRKRKAADQSE